MPEFRDHPPESSTVTDYDRCCFQLYVMLIDADDSGVSWEEAYECAFGEEIGLQPENSKARYFSHLKRARWMTINGYRQL